MRLIKRLLLLLLGLLLLLAAVVAVNTLRQSPQSAGLAADAPLLPVDAEAAALSLAAAVRARTVSSVFETEVDNTQFEALHAHLRKRYPLVHSRLEREVVGRHTLVFTWLGSDTAARPMALMAHQDVVPISPGTDTLWREPPFSGALKDGFVWGRGAWDNKGNLIAELEAVEALLAAGFKPRRTVYLIFGEDEEVGGERGAKHVAALFKERGVKLDFVIDEGMLVIEGMLPGLDKPAALIGVAEKGSASVLLSVQAAGGHSSMPPARGESAIGILSAALVRVDAQPMPGAIQGVARDMFDALAPEMSGFNRVVLSNRWLFGPLVTRSLERSPGTNAILRTTTALTLMHSGIKENVLPGRAEATVNFRLLPGDTADSVLTHVRGVVADPRVELKVGPGAFAASPVSSTDSAAYKQIAGAVRDVFPNTVVAPALMLGATDARHFVGIADHVYRFSPIRSGPQDLPRFHGTNERLSVTNLTEMIRFYHRLVQQAAQ